MTLAPTALAVIGAGSMAGAIARSLASAAPDLEVRLTTRTSVPGWAADAPNVAHRALGDDPRANLDAVDGADAVILGAEPAQVLATAREIAPALAPGTLVVSVAAGVALEDLMAVLGSEAVVARAMPNTPVAIGQGTTAIAVAPAGPADAVARVRSLLSPTGVVEEVPEDVFDLFGAIVGSGPAYVYYLVEALRMAAEEHGLDGDLAARAVPASMAGTVAYLQASGREPGDLRAEVTSPGGMTHAAMTTLDDRGVMRAVRDAVSAAMERSRTLREG